MSSLGTIFCNSGPWGSFRQRVENLGWRATREGTRQRVSIVGDGIGYGTFELDTIEGVAMLDRLLAAAEQRRQREKEENATRCLECGRVGGRPFCDRGCQREYALDKLGFELDPEGPDLWQCECGEWAQYIGDDEGEHCCGAIRTESAAAAV